MFRVFSAISIIIHVTHTFWFFEHLKRVGSVLSRSELDPFLYTCIWYHTVRTQSWLSPCEYTHAFKIIIIVFWKLKSIDIVTFVIRYWNLKWFRKYFLDEILLFDAEKILFKITSHERISIHFFQLCILFITNLS